MLSVLKNLFPTTRGSNKARRTHINPLRPPELLENRDCPAVTAFSIEPLPDVHLSPGQHDVPVLQFTAKGSDWRSALSTLVVDDARQGALNYVRTGSLFYESSPGNWTHLDSSPVSTAYGKRIGFNGFGWVPVGDFDGAHFQVRVDTIDAAFTPVHGELDIVGANVRYGGTPTYTGVTAPGDNHEEFPVTINGGPQRTVYHIVDLPDSAKTVNANSRDQVVYELYANASDPRAFANCMRFETLDGTGLPFIRTATFYREITPGNWHAMMTVRPNAAGQLIFTVFQVHQQFATHGMVHLQVRVNTDPTMVGNQVVNVGWYKSTTPYGGQLSWDVLELNTPPAPPTHGPLSSTALYYPAVAGAGQRLMDVNIGIGPNAAFDTLQVNVGTGSFFLATNVVLRRRDANGNPIGPVLGQVSFNNGTTVVISGIGTIITGTSDSFSLYADLTDSLQIASVSAAG